MVKNKKIKKPARSDEDKEKVYQKIIEEGRKLYVKKGTYGFSTHKLAERLNMVQGNLYNYFESKRELYIAIRSEDFKKLKDEMQTIVSEHKNSYLDLIRKLGTYYLDFAKKESKRFQMMFMIPPPPSDKRGPIEKNYKLIDPLSIIKNVLKKAMENKEIKELDVDLLAYYLFSLFHGATSVERDLLYREDILEPIGKNKSKSIIHEFRNFLFERILNDIALK